MISRTPAGVLFAVLLAAFALAGPAGGGEPAGPAPHPLVVIDVATLVEPVKDFPGPRLELSAGRALESVLRDPGLVFPEGLEPNRPRVLASSDLEDLIRETDPVWESDLENIRLNVVNKRLFVQGPEDAVERLRAFLAVLETEASRSFCVRAVVISVPRGSGATLLGEGGALLPAADVKAKIDALGTQGGAVLADASVTAVNSQRVHILDGSERTFLVDYDAEVAQGAAEVDPVVEVFRDGLLLDVRPTVTPSGRAARLDLHVAFVRFDPDTPRFESGNPKIGPLDLPRVRGFRMESSVTVTLDFGLLLGPLMPSAGIVAPAPGTVPLEGKERDLYLVLQVRSASVEPRKR